MISSQLHRLEWSEEIPELIGLDRDAPVRSGGLPGLHSASAPVKTAQPPSGSPRHAMNPSSLALDGLPGALVHELSQPLASILSNAQAALRLMEHEQPCLTELREILVDIVNEDRRAGHILHGLRLLMTADDLRFDSVDLNEAVHVALGLFRRELKAKEVSLSVELAPDLCFVRGDGVQLQQVVLNLLMNACEAMSGVAPDERRLSVVTVPGPDGQTEVVVTDSGCGIPVGALESIFDPLFTTRKGGFGLGLPLCRKIVAAHGGRLWAEHSAGRGSRFRFTLPSTTRDSA